LPRPCGPILAVSRPLDSGIAFADSRFSYLAVFTEDFRLQSRTTMRPAFGQIPAFRPDTRCLNRSGNDEDDRSSGRRLASTTVRSAALAECHRDGGAGAWNRRRVGWTYLNGLGERARADTPSPSLLILVANIPSVPARTCA
jgi:hypothetical protein